MEKTGLVVNYKLRMYGPWFETDVTWEGLTPGQREILLERGPAALSSVLARQGYNCIPADSMKYVGWDDDRRVGRFIRSKR